MAQSIRGGSIFIADMEKLEVSYEHTSLSFSSLA
ncbi:hypothetical protein X740_16960 [Mesorhizobium sp. LNHC221B00]|nr:hypothetical protein X740_16960 [Mesorhizobium sp. LNHC221B00]